MTTPLLTPKDVAKIIGYRNHVSVLRAFKRGELSGFKVNSRTVRFSEEDVNKWIESKTHVEVPQSNLTLK